jgi:hypothetical protein
VKTVVETTVFTHVRERLRRGYHDRMAGERTYAILPCPDLVEAVAFYAALGFVVTYQQQRPNPYAVVGLDDIVIHLAGVDGFDPET